MRTIALAGSLILILAIPVSAATYIVHPDGTGDFPTIQAAVDAAVDGDIIELGDGVFTGEGNRDVVVLGVELTIRSQSGNPEQCIIDSQGSAAEPHRALYYRCVFELYYNHVEGITFANGHAEEGGGVLSREQAIVSFANCIFRDNRAISGGGMYAVCSESGVHDGSMSAPDARLYFEITGCRFENNSSSNGLGGAAARIWTGWPTFRDCEIIGNDGGGLSFTYCGVFFEDCRFIDNTGTEGALVCDTGGDVLEVVGCVFANNSPTALYNNHTLEPLLASNTFWNNEHAITHTIPLPFTMSNTIIANSTVAAFGDQSIATLTCCDLHGNVGGDWVGNLAGQLGVNGNISAAPLFCDPGLADFTLHADSPCAPANSGGCGLIGPLPVGCGMTAIEPATWGSIKTTFR